MALLASLSLPAIVVAAGLAVDVGRLASVKTSLQAAVDASVLAGARAAAGSRDTVATATLNASFAPSGLPIASASWSQAGDGAYTGTAAVDVPAMLMRYAGTSATRVSVTATAYAGSSASPACVTVLDPSATQALLVNSGVKINASTCGFDVHSTGSPAAIFNSGFTQNLTKICVKGANVIQNGGAVAGLQTSCTPPADPFAASMPAVTVGACTVSNMNYSGANALTPGVYCGNFNFNGAGSLNLAAGLYVLKGARWNLNSGWSVNGTGVTFYFADSNSYIQINSGVAINVTAPTSGTYANILMFEPAGLAKSAFTINGSAGHTFAGLFWLPSRNVTFNSVSSVTSEAISMVFNTLILDTIDWSFKGSAFGAAAGAGASARLSR